MWKYLSDALAASELYGCFENSGLLPIEWKGCWMMNQERKDQLLIDKLIIRNCKDTNLNVAWSDSRVTYDMRPRLE